ncbi:MAG: hypothetical protein HZB65_01730 [Candidatus Aenigmarchaeota archaeon]|nr:hypothetical protein [Candidatus Aenigmarchaeota archaeon]
MGAKKDNMWIILNDLEAARKVGALSQEKYDRIISGMTELVIDKTINHLKDCRYVRELAEKLYSGKEMESIETECLADHRQKCFVCNAIAERIKEKYDK